MQRIGLIQIDGEMPNLALMKLSAWHKSKGDKVILMRDKTVSKRLIDFDKVYISCIFEENKEIAKKIKTQFSNAEVGGVGVDGAKLPEIKKVFLRLRGHERVVYYQSFGGTREITLQCRRDLLNVINGMRTRNLFV